jgi:hypothetical protein
MNNWLELLALQQRMGHTLRQQSNNKYNDDCVTDWDWVFEMEGVDDQQQPKEYASVYSIIVPKYSLN